MPPDCPHTYTKANGETIKCGLATGHHGACRETDAYASLAWTKYLGACPVCNTEVRSDQYHVGPFRTQKDGHQWAHATCYNGNAHIHTDPAPTTTPPKPKAKSAAARAIFGG